MPGIRIGRVFRDGKRAGDLRSSARSLEMPEGELLMKEVTLGEELRKPSYWTYSFRLPNLSQYDLPRDYSRSKAHRAQDRGGRKRN